MSFIKTSALLGKSSAVRFLAFCMLAVLAAPAQAQDALPAPTGQIILTVSGNIAVTNGDLGAAFDREAFNALGVTELTTTTPWTDGPQTFSGVLARTVLERLGAEGTVVAASALNDYTVEIPMDELMDYDVLLATEMNGEEMKVSDKGPIWIIYPRDHEPALQDRRLHDRWVWQLKSLQVQ